MAVERTWKLLCDDCGDDCGDAYPVGGLVTPTKLRRGLSQCGWSFDKGRDICEKCTRKREQAQ